MLKSVFIPNKTNAFAWGNVLFLMLLVALGRIEAYAVLFGYFLETIIIGVFNCFKMYACHKNNDKGSSVFKYILFFIAHYGFFIAVQSIFVFAFSVLIVIVLLRNLFISLAILKRSFS